MKSEQKITLVTGANSGTGKATALAFAKQGMHVVMLCRNEARGQEALEDIRSQSGGDVELMLCDLADFSSIQRFCDEFKRKFDRLNILVNNAGVITLDRRETKDGLELQFGVNHMGHFLLTTSLLPLMKQSDGARIVVVASGAHKVGRIHFDDLGMHKGYTVVAAYGRSKLCNVLFTKELARRLDGSGVTVNCLHPGAVGSNMGVDRDTGFGKTVMRLLRPFFLTPQEGAATAIYVATSPDCANVSGMYFVKCKVAKTARRANDKQLAEKLWEVSEDIIEKWTSEKNRQERRWIPGIYNL
jgi:NAD(P)-dependent dehydrogenase (short-subunit alcohol dehydrogenase family)